MECFLIDYSECADLRNVPVTIEYVYSAPAKCGLPEVVGCAKHYRDRCVILIERRLKDYPIFRAHYREVLKHEKLHCLGWDHPRGATEAWVPIEYHF